MAGSAIGYTLASGESYDSATMVGTAIVGGAVGAGSAVSGPLGGVGFSIAGAEAQTLISDVNDGELPTGLEVGASAGTGVGGAIFSAPMGALANKILPGSGPIVTNLVSSFATEYVGNKITNRADFVTAPFCFYDYQHNDPNGMPLQYCR